MLYWPKFLVTGYAITRTTEAFIPLYFIYQLQLTLAQTSTFIACVFLSKCLFSGFWTTWLEHQQSQQQHQKRHRNHAVALLLLTFLSSIAFLLLFVILPKMMTLSEPPQQLFIWLLISVSALMYGALYQPLGILIDSTIMKTLGDFRVLFFGSYVHLGQSITIAMTGLIGTLIKYVSVFYAEDEKKTPMTVLHFDDDHNDNKNTDFTSDISRIQYLDTLLLITAMIGFFWICMTVSFIKIKPATANDLGIKEEQAPLLLKNALQLTADQIMPSTTATLGHQQQYPYNSMMAAAAAAAAGDAGGGHGGGGAALFGIGLYKPYSLFAEQLSHISEEDASQMDRVYTNNTPTTTFMDPYSLRPVDSHDSAHSYYSQQSNNTAISGPFIYNTFSRQSAAANSSILDYEGFLNGQYSNSNDVNNNNYMSDTTIAPTNAIVASNALALLPAPKPSLPLVAFYSLFISKKPNATRLLLPEPYVRRNSNDTEDVDHSVIDNADELEAVDMEEEEETDEEEPNAFYCYNNYYHRNSQQQQLLQQQWQEQQKAKKRRMTALCLTLFCLGITYSLQNSFLSIYLFSHLNVSVSVIAWLLMIHMIFGDLIVTLILEKYFTHRLNLTCITTSVHFILMFCSIGYLCLTPAMNPTITICSLFLLQALQASAFQLMWLSGIDQVNLFYYLQSNRMKQRSKLSAYYSSIGPMIGSILACIILLPQQPQRSEAPFSMEDYTLIFKSSIALVISSFVISWGWTFNQTSDMEDAVAY